MSEQAEQETCPMLLSLPTPPCLINTPVLAVDGVSITRGVDHSEAKLHSSLLNLHG